MLEFNQGWNSLEHFCSGEHLLLCRACCRSLPRRSRCALLVPGLVMGALGATIMTLVVEPGRTFSAVIVGFFVGSGVPLIVFWGLAALGPKNEATLGYGIFGFLFAVPSGIAGIIAGSWRGSMPPRADARQIYPPRPA